MFTNSHFYWVVAIAVTSRSPLQFTVAFTQFPQSALQKYVVGSALDVIGDA
jgi:hypothetical protein